MLAGEEENATISQAQVNYQENSQQNYKIHNNRIRENAQPNSKRHKPRWTSSSNTKQIHNQIPKATAKYENEFENTIKFLFRWNNSWTTQQRSTTREFWRCFELLLLFLFWKKDLPVRRLTRAFLSTVSINCHCCRGRALATCSRDLFMRSRHRSRGATCSGIKSFYLWKLPMIL